VKDSQTWQQCEATYEDGRRCQRSKGHPGEHCIIRWELDQGEFRLWWKDKEDKGGVSLEGQRKRSIHPKPHGQA